MNAFEKNINKVFNKECDDKAQITLVNNALVIENLAGNETLALTLDQLRSGMLAEIAHLLRPEDVAAILLMLQSAQQPVLLAQADSSISAQLSSLQVLARVSESNGDITVKRAGQTFNIKVG
jgi:hypothetical protein